MAGRGRLCPSLSLANTIVWSVAALGWPWLAPLASPRACG